MVIRATAVVLLALPACDDDLPIACFQSGGGDGECRGGGGGQPGASLAEGGEIRHERVYIRGAAPQAWIQLYQYKGPGALLNAPLPTPDLDADAHLEPCVDERDPAAASWPFRPIAGTSPAQPTYLELPMTELVGSGITGVLTIPRTDPPNTIGNSTYRTYDFTYGGGLPGTDAGGFNATLSPEVAEAGGHYTLEIGQGPMDYYLPEDYQPPRDIGRADTVPIAKGEDLVLDWDAPPNDRGSDGTEQNRKTYFNYVLFVDPSAAFPPQFLCFPQADGVQTISRSVIEKLPPSGIIIHTSCTHYMEKQDAGGEDRRFDLVGAIVNISSYTIE